MAQQHVTGVVKSTEISEARVDAFLEQLHTLSDNREALAESGRTRITVEDSFASPGKGHIVQSKLMKAEARIDFAEFLNSNLPPGESLSSVDLESFVDLYLEVRSSAATGMEDLYKKVDPNALKMAILEAGELYIEAFNSAHESGGDFVINLPGASALEKFDQPIVDLDAAVEAFVDFNTSHIGGTVQQFSSTPSEQVIAFSAYRAAKGHQDDPAVIRELLEFAK